MAGNINQQDYNWMHQNPAMANNSFDREYEYNNLQSQQLDFQSFGEMQPTNDAYYMSNTDGQYSEYTQTPQILTPMNTDYAADPANDATEFDEPPLLEELEIYPDRIMEKTVAVLNPFRSQGLADDSDFLAKQTDLAGPISFCLVLAVCLFLSGNKAPFGYIYGLSVISCIMMYILLTLMTTNTEVFTLANVASILGYCLLPIVGLSVIGMFVSLHGNLGILLAIVAVFWSSLSASRLFVAMSGDHEQRPLIAYPCALVCGVFALLVVF